MHWMLALSKYLAALMDWPLGWMLALPRDATVFLLALGTALLLTFVRKWTTNQDLLHRCKVDLKILGKRDKAAKQAKDTTTRKRIQATTAAIKMIQTKSEGLGLVVSIVPIVLLASWAYERLAFLPPAVGASLTVRADYSLASVNQPTHLIPSDHLEMISNSIQTVQVDPANPQHAFARWQLRAPATPATTDLVIRHDGCTVHQPVRIGERTYDTPRTDFADQKILSTEVELEHPLFLGFIPGWTAGGLDSWMIGYLAYAIAMVPLLRWLLRIA